jgi:transcriptional regulator
MANRTKTERNEKILELANKGWRHVAIAKMFKMKIGTVSMVIWRAKHKEKVLVEQHEK